MGRIIAFLIFCIAYSAVGSPLLAVVVVVWVARFIMDTPNRKREEKIQKDFAAIDSMNGQQFEYYIAQILLKWGYQNVQLTKASGDYGVDIIAYGDGVKIAFQCKRYAKNLA